MRVLLNWLLSAVALMIVARLLPDKFIVRSFAWALVAALVIGFVNATLGAVLKVIEGAVSVALDAGGGEPSQTRVASAITPGFEIIGFFAAFWGAVALMIINMIFRWFTRQVEER